MKLLFTVIMSVLLSACLMLAGVAFYKLKEADKQPAKKFVTVWQICPVYYNLNRKSGEPCQVFPDTTWMRTDSWYEIYYMFTRLSDPADVVSFNGADYDLKELAYPAE